MNLGRVRALKQEDVQKGPVVYWMSRDQRTRDNWALLWAQETALNQRAPLAVLFCLAPAFLHAAQRHYGFMRKGLQEVERDLAGKRIPFFLIQGVPEKAVPAWLQTQGVSTVVTDFDPLCLKRAWRATVSERVGAPFYEVDAHNIVPCWVASQKQEYGAYTLRPKIHRLLDQYLEEFPPLETHPIPWKTGYERCDWNDAMAQLRPDRSVPEVDWIEPGEREAQRALGAFISGKLSHYRERSSNPMLDGQSHLSPYLHFGQLSAQRVALAVLAADVGKEVKEAFLEELIVRRELADNLCYFNPDYDHVSGFPAWARKSLDEHRKDPRDHLYSRDQFEQAKTHDDLWNGAQRELVVRGKMHGYMRMYWAKKILEWSPSPEVALETAIYLNDRYALDGRDPNGYAGMAWSIGGVHDRAWSDRPVFGKVRYMSYNGCKAKFNIRRYIDRVEALS